MHRPSGVARQHMTRHRACISWNRSAGTERVALRAQKGRTARLQRVGQVAREPARARRAGAGAPRPRGGRQRLGHRQRLRARMRLRRGA